jgi:hypothetical protein
MKMNSGKLMFLMSLTAWLFIGILAIINSSRSGDAYFYNVPVTAQWKYTNLPMFECSWCHRTKALNRHHIVPQRADITKRDDAANLIVLCRDCHFVLGHRCDWKQFNPDVVEICSVYTNCLISSEYSDKLCSTNNATGE